MLDEVLLSASPACFSQLEMESVVILTQDCSCFPVDDRARREHLFLHYHHLNGRLVFS